jgi:hypothetical protein
MKKWKSLVGILLMVMGNNAHAQLILERTLLLSDYPSGSSIEFFDNRLFVIGDDATQLMILNPNYNKVDSVRLFKGADRISKNKKTDLESSAIVNASNQQNLLLLGSSSTKRRQQILLYPLNQGKTVESISIKQFNKRLMSSGLNELNFEGLAATANNMIISNRGHLGNPSNHFVVTDLNFWKNQKRAAINIININLREKTKSFAGISGLTYVASKDILLFTASTEGTASTYDDGEISDSYLGWITNFSTKTALKELSADGFINLSENNQTFSKQKIESVTLQEVQNNTLILHLVADNDNGQSSLFRVRLTL